MTFQIAYSVCQFRLFAPIPLGNEVHRRWITKGWDRVERSFATVALWGLLCLLAILPNAAAGQDVLLPHPQKLHKEVHQRYDKFADTTKVSVLLSYHTDLFSRLVSTATQIGFSAKFQGREASSPPPAVSIGFEFIDIKTSALLAEDSSKARQGLGPAVPPIMMANSVTSEALPAPNPPIVARAVFLVDDSDRLAVDLNLQTRVLLQVGDSIPLFALHQLYIGELPIALVVRLASAKHIVEGRLEGGQFKLENDELDKLRDFTSRLAPPGYRLPATLQVSVPEVRAPGPTARVDRSTPKDTAARAKKPSQANPCYGPACPLVDTTAALPLKGTSCQTNVSRCGPFYVQPAEPVGFPCYCGMDVNGRMNPGIVVYP